MADDFSAVIQKVQERRKNIRNMAEQLQKYAAEEAPKTMKEIKARFNRYTRKRAKEFFDQAVTAFYEDYTPKKYKRQGNTAMKTGGLYDVLAMEEDSDLPFPADPPDFDELYNKLLPVNKKGGSLFTSVFEHGYHGGAEKINSNAANVFGEHPNTGVAYWRRPGYIFDPDTGEGRFHMWGRWYGSPAEQMIPSPYKLISQNLNEADASGGEFDIEYKKIRTEEATKLRDKLYEKLAQLKKEML